MRPSLNVGCGDDKRGDIRIDLEPTKKALTILADAHYLPIKDKAISQTLCNSVLEHIKSPLKALLEMKRTTVDEIIIVVPNLINIRRILRTLKNPLYPINLVTRHLQGWDAKEIRHLAYLAGLKVLQIKWRNASPRRWGYMFLPLFASHMIVYMKDAGGELCSKCGAIKKRFWCTPDFTYCPNCDIDPICDNGRRPLMA